MQRFYKEWALEMGTQLLGKVRYAVQSYPPITGEAYINGRTYVAYRGDNEEEAKKAVLSYPN